MSFRIRLTHHAAPLAAAPSHARRLLEEIHAQGMHAIGDLLELYHIDNRYTRKEEEFVTELQIRVTR